MKQLMRITLCSLTILVCLFFLPRVSSKVFAASISSISTNIADYTDSRIPQYKKFEITATLGAAYTNPYDPDEVRVDGYFTSPTGKNLVQPGFYYQNYTVTGIGSSESYSPLGSPVWKVRFAPKEPGTYQYFLRVTDRNGTVNSSTGSFEVVSSTSSGFIGVSPKNSRYFEYDSGKPFIGLGLNVGWWQDNSQAISFYQYYLNRMGEYSANLARVWMSNGSTNQGWIMSVQDKTLGSNYNLMESWAFDYILNIAEQKGVTFLLTLDDVNQYGNNWNSNLYKSTNGGPCGTADCVFTNATAKKYHKQLFRYVIGRWGYSTSILSWEMFNEINELQYAVDNWNWSSIISWHQEMIQYINSVDAHKHMANTSTGSFKTYQDMYGKPEMSFSQLHFYYVPGWVFHPSDPAGQDMADLMRYYSYQVYASVTDKPATIGEWGLLTSGWTDNTDYLSKDDKGVHLHNGIWSSLMSGLATSALSWHWNAIRDHDVLWWQHFKALNLYFAGIDYTGLTALKPVNVNFSYPNPPGQSFPAPFPDNRTTPFASANTKLRVLGLRNNNTTYVWIQNTNSTWWNYVRGTPFTNQSGTVTVNGLTAGTSYSVEWWDAYAGTIIRTESLQSDGSGSISLSVTNLQTDIAVKLIKSGAQIPTPTPTPVHCSPLGDIDCSGIVDAADLKMLLGAYGRIYVTGGKEDLDGNGKVNTMDAAIVGQLIYPLAI